MWNKEIQIILDEVSQNIYFWIATYMPRILWAIAILGIWALIAIWVYRGVKYLFKKFKIKRIIDKLEFNVAHQNSDRSNEDAYKPLIDFKKKIKIDEIVAKWFAYYIFLVFFRLSIVALDINEIEIFLADLIAYIPSVIIAILIGFFGIRFANFCYDVVYHTLKLTNQKTSKIIANWAKIILLFFTLMIVLNYIKIVDEFIINTIFVWFISMLTLAWGLAFGLWGKDIAKEILESFRK